MGRFKNIFLKDFWIKAFSLVFAIFLWMSIVGGESAEEFYVVPLAITNIPENMIISNDVGDYVNVRVRGQRGVLNSLTAKQIHVELDLKNAVEGESTVTLFQEEVKVPEGITVVRVSPSQFTVQLRKLTEKWLFIRPNFLGSPPSGYQRKAVVTPAKVAVMGLEESLKDRVEIETAPIDSFGKTRSFSVDIDLKPVNANVYIKGPSKVRVDVEITEDTGEREFRNLPLTIREPSAGVALRPDSVTLVVSGPKSGLAKLVPSMIQAVIPEQKSPGTFQVKPEVVLPQGFQTTRMEPDSIEVKVEKNE